MKLTVSAAGISRSRPTPSDHETATQFAVCLENLGQEASLVLGKVYAVVPDPKAAKDDLIRIVDESGDDYLFSRSQFEVVEFPHAVRRRLLALQKAG